MTNIGPIRVVHNIDGSVLNNNGYAVGSHIFVSVGGVVSYKSPPPKFLLAEYSLSGGDVKAEAKDLDNKIRGILNGYSDEDFTKTANDIIHKVNAIYKQEGELITALYRYAKEAGVEAAKSFGEKAQGINWESAQSRKLGVTVAEFRRQMFTAIGSVLEERKESLKDPLRVAETSYRKLRHQLNQRSPNVTAEQVATAEQELNALRGSDKETDTQVYYLGILKNYLDISEEQFPRTRVDRIAESFISHTLELNKEDLATAFEQLERDRAIDRRFAPKIVNSIKSTLKAVVDNPDYSADMLLRDSRREFSKATAQGLTPSAQAIEDNLLEALKNLGADGFTRPVTDLLAQRDFNILVTYGFDIYTEAEFALPIIEIENGLLRASSGQYAILDNNNGMVISSSRAITPRDADHKEELENAGALPLGDGRYVRSPAVRSIVDLIGSTLPVALDDGRLVSTESDAFTPLVADALVKDLYVLNAAHQNFDEFYTDAATGILPDLTENILAVQESSDNSDELANIAASMLAKLTGNEKLDLNEVKPGEFDTAEAEVYGVIGNFLAFRCKYGEVAELLMPNIAELWKQNILPGINMEIERRERGDAPVFDDLVLAHNAVGGPKISTADAITAVITGVDTLSAAAQRHQQRGA